MHLMPLCSTEAMNTDYLKKDPDPHIHLLHTRYNHEIKFDVNILVICTLRVSHEHKKRVYKIK